MSRTDSRQPAADVEEQDRLLHSTREPEIRRRAYEIYLEHDSQSGRELEDWLQAEHELEQNGSFIRADELVQVEARFIRRGACLH